MVDFAVLGLQLDSILKVFSNWNDSINSAILQNFTLEWLVHMKGAVRRLKEASKIVGFILPCQHNTLFMKLELCMLMKNILLFLF